MPVAVTLPPGHIPELEGDPVSPTPNTAWVQRTTHPAPSDGDAMGVLGLTYAHGTTSYSYKLSYKTTEGSIIRTALL